MPGVDNVSTYRKLHVFRPDDERLFVLQSAGSLATTHEVLDQIAHDLSGPGESLGTVEHLFEAALYLGELSVRAAKRHEETLGANATATFILGGQVRGEPADILLVYPRATTSGRRTTGRSSRSARRSTARRGSTSPSGRRPTCARPPRSRCRR